MTADPVRQHWVPKVYLRSFCVPPIEREQINIFDLKSGREFTTSIGKIAVKRHFYTLGLRNDRPSYAVERGLSKLESAVKPLILELINTEKIFSDANKRLVFSVFLASLLMRSRQGLQIVIGHREAIRSGEKLGGTRMPEKIVQELLALDSEGMREHFAKSVLPISTPIASHLLSMKWHLIRANEDHFITSENPFVLYHGSEKRWGVATPGVHIHIPISPTLLLHIRDREAVVAEDTTFDLSKEGVEGINGLTILNAEQYLFSSRDFSSIKDLLKERPAGSKWSFGPFYKQDGSS
jgi:hypothetical protein